MAVVFVLLSLAGIFGSFVLGRRRGRQEVQPELDEQVELLARMADLIPYAIFWKDRDSVFRGCNTAFAEFLELEGPSAVVGKTDRELPFSVAEADLYRAEDLEVMASGQASLRAIEHKTLGDREVWLEKSRAPLVGPGGVFGILGVFADITEAHLTKLALERTSAELQEARADLEMANAARSEFLTNMSHEIRTPLTAIFGYLDLIADPREAALREAHLTVVRANASHLLGVINDVLDLSRLESGRLELETLVFPLQEITSAVHTMMAAPAAAKGLDLELRFETEVPGQLRSDPTRLRQILLNLVGSAIKFTEAGSVRVHVSWRPAAGRGLLEFEVVDTGLGIPEDKQASMFEAFGQADASPSRRFGGTGLRLTIARRLAQRLGGDISVRSTLGVGSRFCVQVRAEAVGPLVRPPSSKPTQGAQLSSLLEHGLKGRRILLAEDVEVNRRLVERFLRLAGAEVMVVGHGGEAIAAVRDAPTPFDVVLMDMQMPEVDGYTATRALRGGGYGGPIIALTAHAMAGERTKCLEAGCSEYLAKPIDRTRLLEACVRHAGDESA